MDKNTIIGLLLILVIMFGFYKYNEPSAEEIASMHAAQIAQQDSLQRVQNAEIQKQKLIDLEKDGLADSTTTLDSAHVIQEKSEYGAFFSALKGTSQVYTLENKLVKIQISSKGAQVLSVELKEYKKYNGEPLILIGNGDSEFSFLLTANNRTVSSSNLFFHSNNDSPVLDASNEAQTLTFSIPGLNGRPVEFKYTLNPDSYRLDFALAGDGLASSLASNSSNITLDWTQKLPQIEKGRSFEERNSQTSYKYAGETSVERLSASKKDTKTLESKVEWVSYKDQFFSTFLRTPTNFQSGEIKSASIDTGVYLKTMSAELIIPYTVGKPVNLEFYYLPNKLKILKAQGAEYSFENAVYMGWGIFGWLNKNGVVPIFNFLERFTSNYGLVILLLTIIIKLIIFPFTYKSYLSTAKMRLLKPEIDEINEKIPDTKPQERQKATMALYSKAGVSPMGGCIPMLFQMPILFAMYSFFPVAFELRQKPFLWAKDLSSYDAFLTWDQHIPGLGTHLSLFCLLMTITNLVYTWINSATTNQSMGTMPMMKYMMYLMPVMFLFVLNDYASGLSYYYFIATLITIIQTVAMRYMVDEDKLMAKLEANKQKKSSKKKTGFSARLEKMQKEQQAAAKKRK